MIQQLLNALIAAAMVASAQTPGVANHPVRPKVQEMPLLKYPPVARAAGVSGDVHFLAQTDGEKVIEILKVSGPPLLTRALEKHLRSWRFDPHSPTQFNVTYRCVVIRIGCDAPDQPDVVRLELPTLIEITTTIRPECDPVEPGRANHHMSRTPPLRAGSGYPER